jgi:hypothetical protein
MGVALVVAEASSQEREVFLWDARDIPPGSLGVERGIAAHPGQPGEQMTALAGPQKHLLVLLPVFEPFSDRRGSA